MNTVSMQARRLVSAVVVVVLLGAGCAADGGESSMAAGQETEQVPPTSEPWPAAVPGDEATVVHVVDGDTFDAELSVGTTERVRLPQIDTPEVDQCGYPESAAALESFILGETVRLVPTASGPDRDSHGRLLLAAEQDGDDVGSLLIEVGLARWAPRYAHEDPRLAAMYEEAERQARDEEAGLWSHCGWS